MKKLLLVFLLLSVICHLPSVSMAANVKVLGRQLIVDGQPFTVKGVNYGYTPVGRGYDERRSVEADNWDWTMHPEFYKKDFELIRAMGANTIRLHDNPDKPGLGAVMDAAYEYGLYVILTINISWTDDLSSSAGRNKVLTDVATYVEKWKNHPALLIWLVGNEINVWNKVAPKRYWYSLLNESAQLAHSLEGANYHPVTSAEAEITDLANAAVQSDDYNMTAIDLWAAQIYRGPYMDSVFSDYAVKSTKPLIITEFGTDAYNTKESREDQVNQSATLQQQLTSIQNNLSAVDVSKVCVGGCIFQWADDWSKTQWGYANAVHDTSGQWNSSAYYDYETSDKNNMNEEWWGLVGISADTDEKTLRQAYYTVQSMWQPNQIGKASSGEIFQTEVRNFPNPFNPNNTSTEITFAVAASSDVSVKVYDSVGNLVKVLKEEKAPDMYTEYTLLWDGKDENNEIVGNGVYICYVYAASPNGIDTKYRKIVVLK